MFTMFVDSLDGELQAVDEQLLARLRYFAQDVNNTADRIRETPGLALTLVHRLSTEVQQLDADAGARMALAKEVSEAKRWALTTPHLKLHE